MSCDYDNRVTFPTSGGKMVFLIIRIRSNFFDNLFQNFTFTLSAPTSEILTSTYDSPTTCICIWLKEVEKYGFITLDLNTEVFDNLDDDDPDMTGNDDFAVMDPYGKISEDQVEKYSREDGQDDSVGLKGYCSAYLRTGYQLSGCWKSGQRQGKGLTCGQALENIGVKCIWGKYQGGVLNGPGKVELLNEDCTLEGQFVNGFLHGPVRGLNAKGT
jgi:hypothetical protein